jgi:hypothetical protein
VILRILLEIIELCKESFKDEQGSNCCEKEAIIGAAGSSNVLIVGSRGGTKYKTPF